MLRKPTDSPGIELSGSNYWTAIHIKEIGDVNGDGIKDFIRDNGTTVEIIDGANSVLVNQAGSSIDGIGDIDNDGYYDVVAGDPTTVTGTVYQINGTSSVVTAAGSPIGNAGDQSGYAVAGIGDFNGDGKSVLQLALLEQGQTEQYI
ncbi:MAG: integrin alpha [Alphaproteobacteria bacterium]